MRSDDITLGGEFSGHLYVFENYYPFDDAIICRLPKFLRFLQKGSLPLSAHFSNLKRLSSNRFNRIRCPDPIKFDVMTRVVDAFRKFTMSILLMVSELLLILDGRS